MTKPQVEKHSAAIGKLLAAYAKEHGLHVFIQNGKYDSTSYEGGYRLVEETDIDVPLVHLQHGMAPSGSKAFIMHEGKREQVMILDVRNKKYVLQLQRDPQRRLLCPFQNLFK